MVIVISNDRQFAAPLADRVREKSSYPVRVLSDYESFILLLGAVPVHLLVLDYQEPKERFLVFIRLMKKTYPEIQVIGLFNKIPLVDTALDASLDRLSALDVLPDLVKEKLTR